SSPSLRRLAGCDRQRIARTTRSQVTGHRSQLYAPVLKFRPINSIVLLVQNLLSIPTQRLQQLPICFHHPIQSADVSVHVGARADDTGNMVLYITAQGFPLVIGAAESWQKVKVRMLSYELLELIAVIQVRFGARAEQKPELAFFVARRI